MRLEDIANALRISVPTLRKHYGVELSSGAALRRMEVLEKLLSQAKKGSTSAARAYLANQPEFMVAPEEEKPVRQPRKGKKEQAQEDAGTAQNGTGWDGLLPAGNVTPLRKSA